MQITAEELKGKMDRKENFVLLDVREQTEWDICHIEGAKLIPLREVPTRFKELSPNEEMVVYCHHGGRSERAAGFLRQQGFSKVANLQGGIDAWSEDVDPAMPRY